MSKTILIAEDEKVLRESLAGLLGLSLISGPPADVTPPAGPGRDWTTADAVAAVDGHLEGRVELLGGALSPVVG